MGRAEQQLQQAVTSGDAAAALSLLSAGADANATTSKGESVLCVAARRGREDIVGALIASKARIDAVHFYFAVRNNHVGIVRLLAGLEAWPAAGPARQGLRWLQNPKAAAEAAASAREEREQLAAARAESCADGEALQRARQELAVSEAARAAAAAERDELRLQLRGLGAELESLRERAGEQAAAAAAAADAERERAQHIREGMATTIDGAHQQADERVTSADERTKQAQRELAGARAETQRHMTEASAQAESASVALAEAQQHAAENARAARQDCEAKVQALHDQMCEVQRQVLLVHKQGRLIVAQAEDRGARRAESEINNLRELLEEQHDSAAHLRTTMGSQIVEAVHKASHCRQQMSLAKSAEADMRNVATEALRRIEVLRTKAQRAELSVQQSHTELGNSHLEAEMKLEQLRESVVAAWISRDQRNASTHVFATWQALTTSCKHMRARTAKALTCFRQSTTGRTIAAWRIAAIAEREERLRNERIELRIQRDIVEIPAGSDERKAFEAKFIEEMCQQLGVDPSRVAIQGLKAGSIIVQFAILPAADSTPDSSTAAALKQQLAKLVEDPESDLYSKSSILKDVDPKVGLRAASVWQRCLRGSAFRSWKLHHAEVLRLKRQIMTKMTMRAVYAAFNSWTLYTQRSKRMKHRARQFLQRGANRSTASAFATWVDFAVQQRLATQNRQAAAKDESIRQLRADIARLESALTESQTASADAHTAAANARANEAIKLGDIAMELSSAKHSLASNSHDSEVATLAAREREAVMAADATQLLQRAIAQEESSSSVQVGLETQLMSLRQELAEARTASANARAEEAIKFGDVSVELSTTKQTLASHTHDCEVAMLAARERDATMAAVAEQLLQRAKLAERMVAAEQAASTSALALESSRHSELAMELSAAKQELASHAHGNEVAAIAARGREATVAAELQTSVERARLADAQSLADRESLRLAAEQHRKAGEMGMRRAVATMRGQQVAYSFARWRSYLEATRRLRAEASAASYAESLARAIADAAALRSRLEESSSSVQAGLESQLAAARGQAAAYQRHLSELKLLCAKSELERSHARQMISDLRERMHNSLSDARQVADSVARHASAAKAASAAANSLGISSIKRTGENHLRANELGFNRLKLRAQSNLAGSAFYKWARSSARASSSRALVRMQEKFDAAAADANSASDINSTVLALQKARDAAVSSASRAEGLLQEAISRYDDLNEAHEGAVDEVAKLQDALSQASELMRSTHEDHDALSADLLKQCHAQVEQVRVDAQCQIDEISGHWRQDADRRAQDAELTATHDARLSELEQEQARSTLRHELTKSKAVVYLKASEMAFGKVVATLHDNRARHCFVAWRCYVQVGRAGQNVATLRGLLHARTTQLEDLLHKM